MQLIEEATFWHAQQSLTEVGSQEWTVANAKLTRILEEWLPPNTEQMNRALATANLVFSRPVLAHAGRLADLSQEVMTAPPGPPNFDRDIARQALAGLAAALRGELLMSEVIPYQQTLFRRSLLERIRDRWKRPTPR